MKMNVEIKLNPVEAIVVLNALKHAKKTKFFANIEADLKKRSTVSMFAWANLADRVESRIEAMFK
jgi:hypothetical protein